MIGARPRDRSVTDYEVVDDAEDKGYLRGAVMSSIPSTIMCNIPVQKTHAFKVRPQTRMFSGRRLHLVKQYAIINACQPLITAFVDMTLITI